MATIRTPYDEDGLNPDVLTLATAAVFTGLTGDAPSRLAVASKLVAFEAGERVVTVAQPGDVCYLIVEGMVVVEDEVRVRAYLGAGDLFGEIAALSRGRTYQMRRTATVHAATPLRAIRLDGAALQSASDAYPRLRQSLRKQVSDRLTPEDLRRHLTVEQSTRQPPSSNS